MKILTAIFLMAIMLLGVSAIFVGFSHQVQSAEQNQMQMVSPAPLIICDDPAQTGRNFCKAGWAKSACEYACANKAKNQCGWSPNSVANCKAQCLVSNGCTPN